MSWRGSKHLAAEWTAGEWKTDCARCREPFTFAKSLGVRPVRTRCDGCLKARRVRAAQEVGRAEASV